MGYSAETIKKEELRIVSDISVELLSVDKTREKYIQYFELNDTANIRRSMVRNDKPLFKSVIFYYESIFKNLNKLYHVCKLEVLNEPVCLKCGSKVWFDKNIGFYEYCKVCNRKDKNLERKTNILNFTSYNEKQVKEDLVKFVSRTSSHSYYQSMMSTNVELVSQVMSRTSYLCEDVKFNERIYHILHDINSSVKCQICGKEKVSFLDFNRGYSFTCSLKCSSVLKGNKMERLTGFRHESQIPDYKGNQSYKCKTYNLPSGKTISIQGYENLALDELLTTYNEEDVFTSRVDMPLIWYFTKDGKRHRYFPDIYIPKDNLIIEVKSEWTYNFSKEINHLKAKSSKLSGYNFKFMIFTDKKKVSDIIPFQS